MESQQNQLETTLTAEPNGTQNNNNNNNNNSSSKEKASSDKEEQSMTVSESAAAAVATADPEMMTVSAASSSDPMATADEGPAVLTSDRAAADPDAEVTDEVMASEGDSDSLRDSHQG